MNQTESGNNNIELIQEFMALRGEASVLELSTPQPLGYARKLLCGDEEIRFLELAKEDNSLRIDPKGALEFHFEDQQKSRLEWVDAQAASVDDETLISTLAKPIL